MYDLTTLNQQAAPAQEAARPTGNLATIIERIEEVLDAETAGIRNGRSFDLKASNARKSRHLYDLTRAARGSGGDDAARQHAPALQRLREKLSLNERVVAAHLAAVSEVAKLVQNAIEHAETDGTYSAQAFGQVAG